MDKPTTPPPDELDDASVAEAREVQLGPRKVKLVPPTSFAAAADVVELARKSRWRAYGAALGLCVPQLSRWLRVPDLAACDYSTARFGGGILDGLKARKVSLDDIGAAGSVAYTLVAGSLVSEGDVKAAEGFSDPVEAESTST